MVSKLDVAGPRILMLCNDRKIDRRVLLQADSLEEAGWTVTVLSMPLDEGKVDTDSRVQRIGGSVDHASMWRVNGLLLCYRTMRRWLPTNNSFVLWLKSLAWQFLVNYERFYLNLFLKDGRKYHADVVVAHDLPMLAVGHALATEFGARLVYDSHELFCEQDFSKGQRLSWAKVEARHIHACDRVITVNPSIARELEKRYKLNKVHVIHNAEKMKLTKERSWYLHDHFDIPRQHQVLLYQGGLSARRNLDQMVAAMALLERDDVHLVILGDGELSDYLNEQIESLQLSNRVHMHPAVEQERLLSVTVSASAGIIPYQATCLNNFYCTPNKLFEFIATCLPVLASDLPEIRRLVVGNSIGQVFDLTTPSNIAKAIFDFFSDDDRLEGWKNNLCAVRHQLCWQSEGELLKEIYEPLKTKSIM